MKTTRRDLLLSTTALALLAAAPLAVAQSINLDELNAAPAHGEMEVGSKDAKVTIIEYASASCPHCAAFFKDVYLPLKKDYIDTGKVRFIFREFPHNDIGLAGFMLARCAPAEKYFPIVDVLFETQATWMENPPVGLKEIAKQAGMTEDAFNACLQNEKVAKDIIDAKNRATSVAKIEGIPTVFINGVKIEERDYESIKKKIDPLLG
jgi:protein-disulfide isomerase